MTSSTERNPPGRLFCPSKNKLVDATRFTSNDITFLIMKSPQLTRQERTSFSLPAVLARHWFMIFVILFGLLVGLPFVAPVLMRLGLIAPAKGIYLIYSFLCHQLPERSFFFFGTKTMYSLSDIQAVWQNTINPLVLRQFIGNPDMGWKTAWSDRMVSMYSSLFLFGIVWRLFRGRVQGLRWWWLVLLLLPMVVDGTSHMISDLWGLGGGFRDTNAWLAELTNYALQPSFYAGDALGSFNSWMRLLTGILFGIGIVWFTFPYVDETFSSVSQLVPAQKLGVQGNNDRTQ